MARSATGAAQENPLQIYAVAHGDSARKASVGSNVVFMKLYVGIPFDRMLGKYPAHMALRTRRSTPLNTPKIGSVTGDVGTGRRAVRLDISPVQSVGEISPQDGMNRFRVAEMTLGAGDMGSRAS
jgi:hypothetical protein